MKNCFCLSLARGEGRNELLTCDRQQHLYIYISGQKVARPQQRFLKGKEHNVLLGWKTMMIWPYLSERAWTDYTSGIESVSIAKPWCSIYWDIPVSTFA